MNLNDLKTILSSGLFAAIATLLLINSTVAAAQRAQVRVTGLQDVSLGELPLQGETRVTQSICVFSSGLGDAYSVTASGTGALGAFTLNGDSEVAQYRVEWSEAPNSAVGERLEANVPSSQFSSMATHQSCNNGPSSSATLIISISAIENSDLGAGQYAGSLSVIVAPF